MADQETNDTFLSRVFGLHSIYNQLQDNYQYYDPDTDDVAYSQPQSPLLQPSLANGGNNDTNSVQNNLIDSELDLDLSSVESEPEVRQMPTIRKKPNPVSTTEPDEVPKPSPPKERKLKFANVQGAKDFIFNKLQSSPSSQGLPLYNEVQPAAQQHRKEVTPQPAVQNLYTRKNRSRAVIPPKERALYLWANIINMDEFLIDLYYYYRGKGLLNIVISRIVSIIILVFILSFTVFLKWGIDYNFFINEWSLTDSDPITLKDLIIPDFLYKKVPFFTKFLLFGFVCYIVLRVIQLYFDYNYKLKEIKNFYTHLLGISNDDELMTIPWSVIVERLMLLKDYNTLTSTNSNLPPHYLNDLNSKIRLNAHDIANRIMRKENYMIALINKEILDLSIPIFGKTNPNSFLGQLNIFSTKSVLTKTLEWNLKLCINNFIFNSHGQINSRILKESNRNQLAKDLSSRFKMAAIINLILCPFIVIYFVLLYFFRYFNEYKSNPSSILGLRQYTPWAEWKLREFNELPHFFIKRLHLSIGPANTYINQFPGGFLVLNVMSLVNFISGAITAVLVIMGLFLEDEEHNFWSFEITQGRSSLFYISLFGTLWAITLSSTNQNLNSSSENLNNESSSFFYDPEATLRYVSQFTHYLPSSWKGRLHSVEVKNEFCELYSLKIIIIINEIISLILTPFILWFKISSSAGSIIDFFREYSIHVDGLGYVCYFAMFNFEEKDKNMMHDLNKKKKKPKKYRKYRPTKADPNIELDKIKPRHVADDSEDDSDSSPSLDEFNQDDKMIKSYMYFLESYGQPSANNEVSKKVPSSTRVSSMSRSKPRINESVIGPSNSIVFGSRHQGQPLQLNDLSLTESAYNFNHRIDDDDDEDEDDDDLNGRRGKKGVFGMLNQFYKQDSNR